MNTYGMLSRALHEVIRTAWTVRAPAFSDIVHIMINLRKDLRLFCCCEAERGDERTAR